MITRHAHQFVALCLSALVTASMLAGVNTLAMPAAPTGVMADTPVGIYA